MPSAYPGALDTTTLLPSDVTDDTDSKTGTPRTGLQGFHADLHADANDAIVEIETELGVAPSASYATVRERFEGLDLKQSCRASTVAVLPACTYAAGPPATLTGDANGALAAQDGITLVQGERLFVKDQVAPLQNGIYELTQVGTGALPFILSRGGDADTALKLSDTLMVTVEQGTVNRDSVWELVTDNPVTLGTTALRFTRVHPAYRNATQQAADGWLPSGGLIESLPSEWSPIANLGALTTQTLQLTSLGVLRAGHTLSSLTFASATTAAGTPLNQWACLVRASDRRIMAVSPDATTAAWAASTLKTFTFNTPYMADKDELMWAGLMVRATTVPSLNGVIPFNALGAVPPAPTNRATAGTSNTGQTTPLALATIVTAPTAARALIYCLGK